jgi:LPXTG-site transpeptidase (sortase) family protein
LEWIISMKRWYAHIKASWLFVVGFVLVYIGASGAFSTAAQFWPFTGQRETPEPETYDEGFAPWTVPLELEPQAGAPELEPADVSMPIELPTREITPEIDEEPQEFVSPVVEVIKNTPTPEIVVATPEPLVMEDPEAPRWIAIQSIGLEAPIVQTGTQKFWIEGKQYDQWLAPNEFSAGWHDTSARLGEVGNTVLNGHHNIYGMVFGKLVDMSEGDLITIRGDKREFFYLVTNKMILPEKSVGLVQRLENARWILPSDDERLTLVTCWPFESNTHRLIIVARPVGDRYLDQ